jgi:hypothetical protein
LDWSKLRVVTDLRNLAPRAIGDVNQPFTGPRFLDHTVNGDTDHQYTLKGFKAVTLASRL